MQQLSESAGSNPEWLAAKRDPGSKPTARAPKQTYVFVSAHVNGCSSRQRARVQSVMCAHEHGDVWKVKSKRRNGGTMWDELSISVGGKKWRSWRPAENLGVNKEELLAPLAPPELPLPVTWSESEAIYTEMIVSQISSYSNRTKLLLF